MGPSFEGNEGNEGNAGNASSASGGWCFADRVDLPFVTECDEQDNPIAGQRIDAQVFPGQNWSADWYAWLALTQYVNARDANGGSWASIAPTLWDPAGIQGELDKLVLAAQNERADALGEILSEANEFISYFMNLFTAGPNAYGATLRVLTIASTVALFTSMYYKGKFRRPRPTQLCPALFPPITVPGHASFPSGHSTQSHLMALCMGDVLFGYPQQDTLVDDMTVLADRISRNRELAGLHYPSDTRAGKELAANILPLLKLPLPATSGTTSPGDTWYQLAVRAARAEWDPANY